MDANEIARLAGMGQALRPDWPQRSLRTFIETNLGARAYADVAVALAWVATRTTTETPRLLLEPGPWWRATVTPGEQGYRPPRKDEECQVHLGSYADSCSGCAADKAVGDTTELGNPRRPDRAAELDGLRSLLGQARAELCGCGVPRSHCTDHRPDKPAAVAAKESA